MGGPTPPPPAPLFWAFDERVVNELLTLTPAFLIVSKTCCADRHSDPTPNNTMIAMGRTMEYKYAAAGQAVKSSTRVDAAGKFYALSKPFIFQVVAHEHVARSCHDLQRCYPSCWRENRHARRRTPSACSAPLRARSGATSRACIGPASIGLGFATVSVMETARARSRLIER